MNLEMDVQKAGDVVAIRSGFALFERVGDIAVGECSGVRYEQVGELNKFTQFCRSPSLRYARVALKIMREAAFK
jgi:hypothetical protein